MNIAKIIFLCAVFVCAQQQTLRGFAYNPFGTLGATPTIVDILQKPSDIYGHKFVYASLESISAYSVFDLAGGSAFLSFDKSLTLGYAKNFYGLLLRISPHSLCNLEYEANYECLYDQNISMNFSVPLGSSVIYAHTGKTNKSDIHEEDYVNSSARYKQELSAREAYIGITGGNSFIWDLRFNFDRYKRSYSGYEYTESSIYELDGTECQTDIKFLFNFGYKILQSDRFKFIVGLNNQYSRQHYYYPDYDYVYDAKYYLTFTTSPNFLGEVTLTKHLLAFVGAIYNISSYAFFNGWDEVEFFGVDNYKGSYVGLRYEYENLAIETRLQGDPFEELLSRNNPFIQLGVFFFFQ
ncbi:MAG: hypothetical protein LBC87_11280 [Fibromonadaceae bacterium]|nr:hypothetical protein [Fibromonadaceae bacterium]